MTSGRASAASRFGALLGSLLVLNESAKPECWAREFMHAQRMEAVGRLAGCVAHDFNNLLTTITGFGQMLAESVAGNAKAEHLVAHVLDTADRANGLARQLLTLSMVTSTSSWIRTCGRTSRPNVQAATSSRCA